MDPSEENYLGTVIKNWASQVRPPGIARRRLLWLAAHMSSESEPPYIRIDERMRANQLFTWSFYLTTWNLDQSFHNSLPAVAILV